MASKHGVFHWNELMTRDVEGSKKFFETTLGWTFTSMTTPNGTYWVAKAGGEPVAGVMPLEGPQFEKVPESWLGYIAVDNVDLRVKNAAAAGGEVLQAPFMVTGVGRIAILKDARGIPIGLITPAS